MTRLFSCQFSYRLFFIALAFWLTACAEKNAQSESETTAATVDNASTIVVYSSRNEHLIEPVFERYREITGVEIEYATDKAGVLIERIKAEGSNTPADILFTVDAGTLGYAAAQGIFQPLASQKVDEIVPAHLRDENDLWTGLSLRARTIVYSTERVSPNDLSTYAGLAEEKWKNKLCLRTAKKVYNQSLVAMLISEYGEARAEAVVEDWVRNLAIAPTSNDNKVMQAIINGQCDVGIVNSYYFGRLQQKQPSVALALFWPNQNIDGSGVHVNVAGAGLLKHSKHTVAAKAFLEWLVTSEAQDIFARVNQEYPIDPTAKIATSVSAWGEFTASPLSLSNAYKLQPAAVKLMDRAGYK